MTIADTKYSYEIQGYKANQVVLVINGQIRKQEYFVEKNIVHVFNVNGDQLGFTFKSD